MTPQQPFDHNAHAGHELGSLSGYAQWLSYWFDHPEDDPKWYIDSDAPDFEATDEEIVALLSLTFQRSGTDLLRFSDAQVENGLWFVADNSVCMYIVRDSNMPITQRLQAVSDVYRLYCDCFAKRCTETLSHLDEPGSSPLNGVCYMFWDLSSLTYLEKCRDRAAMEDTVRSVLSRTLEIPHLACQEGALHGLGHMALFDDTRRTRRVVDAFLKQKDLDEDLREYALDAREGRVM
jgi:hypothetical protein